MLSVVKYFMPFSIIIKFKVLIVCTCIALYYLSLIYTISVYSSWVNLQEFRSTSGIVKVHRFLSADPLSHTHKTVIRATTKCITGAPMMAVSQQL